MCSVNTFSPLKAKARVQIIQSNKLMGLQSVDTIAESVQHAVMLFMDVVTEQKHYETWGW